MKSKGIPVWERHAEKFVLLIAFVGAAFLTALQFIGEPNAVSTTAGEVAPGEIDDLLQDKAEQLLAKLRDTAPAGVELPDPALGLDDLLAQRERSLSPGITLPPFQLALAPSVVGAGIGESIELPVPQLSAPDQVAVGQYADALQDGVVERYPELQEHFNPGEPHDLVFATVRARFDLAELRRQFRSSGGDAQGAIIPSSWYNDRPEHIVDVRVEREEFVEGQWTDRRTLELIPGQVSLRAELTGEIFARHRDDMLGRLGNPVYQFQLIQPSFYETKSDDWSIPAWDDSEVVIDPAEADVKKLKDRLKRLYTTREELLDELEAAGGSMDDDEPKKGDPGRGGRGGGASKRKKGGKKQAPGSGIGGPGSGPAGGMGFGAGVGSGSGDPKKRKLSERAVRTLKSKIRIKDREIQRVSRKLEDLGIDLDAVEVVTDPYAALDGDEILVWSHDITVEPGRTYRYRVNVSVYNPFFGKKRSLLASQESLAQAFTLDSPPSKWSRPVRIYPLQRVFIIGASTRGAAVQGFGRATAEVYRFYDGIQWVEKFQVAPGGVVGGVKDVRLPDGTVREIDFSTSFFVLDIVADHDTGGPGRGRPTRPQARVLLQDLVDPQIVEMRDPRIEEKDPDRQRLRDKLPVERPV